MCMRGKSTLPMDSIDVELLIDIIEHFFGDGQYTAEVIRGKRDTVAKNHNPGFDNNDADDIIADLRRIVERTDGRALLVDECTSYDPESSAEEEFLELEVNWYVDMRRQYFEECHNSNR